MTIQPKSIFHSFGPSAAPRQFGAPRAGGFAPAASTAASTAIGTAIAGFAPPPFDPDETARTASPAAGRLYRGGLKRSLDTLLVLLALPLVLPVVLLLAALVALADRHSPLYWSDRVGRDGRIFRMLKLRTMVPDADDRLAAHLAADPAAAAEWAATQKLKRDPRITRIGCLLRKTSFDELPQLWNVLKGDMALVGPRPMMPEQRRLYPGEAYYRLRPGVTGPWQVSARNLSTFAARADFDRDYELDLSPATDLRLILKTIVVVLRGTGY